MRVRMHCGRLLGRSVVFLVPSPVWDPEQIVTCSTHLSFPLLWFLLSEENRVQACREVRRMPHVPRRQAHISPQWARRRPSKRGQNSRHSIRAYIQDTTSCISKLLEVGDTNTIQKTVNRMISIFRSSKNRKLLILKAGRSQDTTLIW
jgi:hypothetical protein